MELNQHTNDLVVFRFEKTHFTDNPTQFLSFSILIPDELLQIISTLLLISTESMLCTFSQRKKTKKSITIFAVIHELMEQKGKYSSGSSAIPASHARIAWPAGHFLL